MQRLFSNRRLLSFVIVLVVSNLLIAGISVFFIYNKSVASLKSTLSEILEHQQSLVSILHKQGKSNEEIIVLIKKMHKRYYDIGKTGEFAIATRKGDSIKYLLANGENADYKKEQPNDSGIPMILALKGKSGFVVAEDYLGIKYYAAYTYVNSLHWGIVAKISSHEVYQADFQTIFITFLITILVISVSIFLFVKLSKPLLGEIYEGADSFSNLFEHTQVCTLLIHTLSGKIVNANSAACEYFGYEQKELVSMKISEIIHLTPDELYQKQKHNSDGKAAHFLFEHKLSNGSIRYLEAFVWNVMFTSEAFNYFMIFDITDRKIAEKELITAKEKIEESEERYKRITAGLTDYLYTVKVKDGKAVETIHNEACLAITGYSSDEFTADPYLWINMVVPEERKKVAERSMKILEGRDVYPSEHRIICKNRTIRWVNDTAILRFDSNGNLISYDGVIKDITEHKLAETELLYTKHLLDETFEQCPVPMVLVSMPDAIYRIINPACKKFLGMEDQPSLINTSLFDLKPSWSDFDINNNPGTLDRLPLARALKGESTFNEERKIVRKDGSIRWALVSGVPIYNSKGELVAGYLIMNDITKNKLADEAMRESEERFRLLAENSTDMIARHDADGRFLYVSPACRTLLGYEPEELIGRLAFDLFHPEDIPILEDNRVTIINQPITTTSIFRIRHKNGDYIWFETTTRTIFDNVTGNVIELHASSRDVTKRKMVEEALRISEERYELINNSSRDSIYSYDKAGRFTSANKNLCITLQLDASQIIGRTHIDLGFPEELCKEWDKLHRQVYETNHTVTDETTGPLPDGTIHYYEVVLNPLHDNHGNIIGIGGTTRDITERKKAELLLQEKNNEIEAQNEEYHQLNEELTQTNDELYVAKIRAEESDRLKTSFLQNLSHEIRTPMNAIMGFSDLLVYQYNDKLKLEKYSEIIRRRSNDLLDIINDILDIAKIESGQLPINIEECNIPELFNELNAFFTEHQKQIGKQHIAFSFSAKCDPSDLEIATDKGKLKQIFINLISNAFKFTDSGEIEGGCIFDGSNNLIFYVADTGIGIPPDKQHVIFERFAQVDHGNSRVYGGTGLGLSIVKGLVNLLGGEIMLESESGKGSKFSFTIPYKPVKLTKAIPPTYIEPIGYQLSNKTVLIVEDDFFNAEFLKEILSGKGLNIIHAQNGKDAVQIALNHLVDIVLMDIRLPDMDGYEATRLIRQYKPNLIIIAQTAYASHFEQQKALDAGCNDYISKPTKQDLLFTIICRQIKAAKL